MAITELKQARTEQLAAGCKRMDQMQTGGRSTSLLRRALGKQGVDSGRSPCMWQYKKVKAGFGQKREGALACMGPTTKWKRGAQTPICVTEESQMLPRRRN